MRLRPAGTTVRRVPQPIPWWGLTRLFNFVACPNYTYEVISWFGFSLMTQSLPGLLTSTNKNLLFFFNCYDSYYYYAFIVTFGMLAAVLGFSNTNWKFTLFFISYYWGDVMRLAYFLIN